MRRRHDLHAPQILLHTGEAGLPELLSMIFLLIAALFVLVVALRSPRLPRYQRRARSKGDQHQPK